ncbi:hypothetical protein SteCoe_6865 [Stentor coeruleus]|uniref:Uncharacterized protein n=1 Tax=Stentor coeruleus TaxID=5963 RepID=A0A1R2CNY4_9CILI|nr:hypothetical protein SteCoe_6865 [Stentor coeruleus]
MSFLRLVKVSSLVRRFGDDYENVFKAYLHQAEEIEKLAKEKAQQQTTIKTQVKAPPTTNLDKIDVILHANNTKPKLIYSSTTQQIQVAIEEVLLSTNSIYKRDKNTTENPITPGALIERLYDQWNKIPEIKIKDINFYSMLRTIWIAPYTISNDDFGTFQRITKSKIDQHSPFFYGPLTDNIYRELALETGENRSGFRMIRKIVDHMSFHDFIPSKELSETLIKESIAGRWPRLLHTIVEYVTKKEVSISHSQWISIITFLRYNKDLFFEGAKLFDVALKYGAAPEWELFQPYVSKFSKHYMTGEAASLVKKARDGVNRYYKSQEEKTAKICSLTSKFLSCLMSFNEFDFAQEHLDSLIVSENYSEDSIEVALKFYEDLKDPQRALDFFNKVVNKDGFVYTSRFVVSTLKMCTHLGKGGMQIVNEIKDKILTELQLCSPFAINMIIVTYSYSEEWSIIHDFLSSCISSRVEFNRYTPATIRKTVEKCLEPLKKSKLLEIANKIEDTFHKTEAR